MKIFESVAKFFSDVSQEMAKVNWPSYEDLKGSTIIVVVLSAIFVVFVFSSDWILTKVLRLIF